MPNALVVVEHLNGKLKKVTLPTVTFARKVVDIVGGEVVALVLGPENVAEEIAQFGVDKVLFSDADDFDNYLAENYASAISGVVNQIDAEYVVTGATNQGKDFAPRLSALLDAGMISESIDVFDEGGIRFRRPMYAGNVIAVVEAVTPRKVITVRATEFDSPAAGAAAPVKSISVSSDSSRCEFVRFDAIVSERPELVDAAVVVSGGRGLKNADGFGAIMEPLADRLGAAIGATRASVDSGMCPNDWQVGQTGKIVAPDLYIAVALSGAIQHVAGMKGSKVIVAINKDEDAPIFQVADYGLVADAFKAVPEFLKKI